MLLLQQSPLLPDYRVSIEEDFYVGIRKNLCSDVTAFHHHTTPSPHFALTQDHPFTHFGMNRHAGSAFGDVSLAHTLRDIAPIQQNAVAAQRGLKLDSR